MIGHDLEIDLPDLDNAEGPSSELLVEFPSGVRIKMGAKMKLADVRDAPVKVKCHAAAAAANQDDLFALAFVDPDAPSSTKHTQRAWLHWLMVNIPGFQLDKGRVLCNYAPSTPPANTGIHRYVFLLFKQEEQLDQVAAYDDSRRGKFSIADFSKKYNLGEVLGVTYYLAERPGSFRNIKLKQ